MRPSSRPAEISEDSWSLLARLFRSPNDIDLYTAGLAESRAEGKRAERVAATRETARKKEGKNERNAFFANNDRKWSPLAAFFDRGH